MSASPPRRGRSSKRGTSQTRSRSPTPPRLGSPKGSSSSVPTNAQFEKAFLKMLSKNLDEDDEYKSIKLPPFSDGSEWEAVIFELKINLEKVWKHSKQMDIVELLKWSSTVLYIRLHYKS